MCRQISMGMWISQIPDKMYNCWVSNKWIAPEVDTFESGNKNGWNFVFDIGNKRIHTSSFSQKKKYEASGGKLIYSRYIVLAKHYNKMHKEINSWYGEVFDYVTSWLQKNKFIQLKKGSFDGGFCATQKEDETTEKWGAPLAKVANKVTQIKEKFGAIVVYTHSLTKDEAKKLNAFATHCETRFDCITRFS